MHSMEAWSGHFCIGTRGHNMQCDAMFILRAHFLVTVRSFILLFQNLIYDAHQVQHTRSIVQIAAIFQHTPPQPVRSVNACTWNTKMLQRLTIINRYGCGNGYTVYGLYIVHEQRTHVWQKHEREQSATGFNKYYKSDTLTDKTKTCMHACLKMKLLSSIVNKMWT